MLNRLLQPAAQKRSAYVDSQGRISRTWVDTYAGVTVDTATTLSVPAIWRAVTMIADDVGSLPIHAYRGITRLQPTPRILRQPNPLETPMETFSAMAAALLLHGNYIALKGPANSTGYPDFIIPVNPEKVSIFVRDGERGYRIDDVVYDPRDVFHIKGFALPGEVAGVGIIAAQRQGIGAAIAVMEYAARYFDGGAMPSYLIKSENPDLTEDEAQLLKQKWVEHYGGRSRIPAVMNSSTDIEVLTANANDAQLVEARNQSILDSANMVGVPGNAVGAPNTSRTYTNTELQALEYIKTSLRPIVTRIEQSMSTLLPNGQEARMSYDALLRPDTLTRYQAHKIALEAGFLTVDEVRQLEHREPLGEDEPADMEEPPELDDDLSYQEDGLDQDTPAFDMEDMNA